MTTNNRTPSETVGEWMAALRSGRYNQTTGDESASLENGGDWVDWIGQRIIAGTVTAMLGRGAM